MILKGESQPGDGKNFEYRPYLGLVKSYDEVQGAIDTKQPQQVIDGRPKEAFDAGNIPGSINLPFSTLKDEDGFIRDKNEIQEIFKKAGVDTNQPMIFSCGGGVMATFLLAAAESAKCKGDLSVYDGAWSEYSKKSVN